MRDQPDDEEELPVLPLQEVPRGGHEDRLGPARRGAPQVRLYAGWGSILDNLAKDIKDNRKFYLYLYLR